MREFFIYSQTSELKLVKKVQETEIETAKIQYANQLIASFPTEENVKYTLEVGSGVYAIHKESTTPGWISNSIKRQHMGTVGMVSFREDYTPTLKQRTVVTQGDPKVIVYRALLQDLEEFFEKKRAPLLPAPTVPRPPPLVVTPVVAPPVVTTVATVSTPPNSPISETEI